MASEVKADRKSYRKVHAFAAWGKWAWLALIGVAGAVAVLLRLAGCSAYEEPWYVTYLCSPRAFGLVVLLLDLAIVWVLLWLAVVRDASPSPEVDPRFLEWPHTRLMQSHLALRHKDTPHRRTTRIGFWIFVAMAALFYYLVGWSEVVFY